MNKKFIAAISTVVTLTASSAYAENTGCGWGTTVFEGDSGKVKEVLAVTTNGTLGNQTFGITTGTAGCDEGATIASAEVQVFASANMDKLARDMAVGEGETLDSLADLMKIDKADKAKFFTLTKTNFDKIYPSVDVTTGEMLSALQDVMTREPDLARYAA
ncbi:MAG: DUF3015 domain-containing protein [Gammaproteobacteria bacterium]|nr:DUF3015 domain-containing protein [Gammaproteobacteria bacterium]